MTIDNFCLLCRVDGTEGVDFLETAKRRGCTVPLPRLSALEHFDV